MDGCKGHLEYFFCLNFEPSPSSAAAHLLQKMGLMTILKKMKQKEKDIRLLIL